MSQTRDQGSGIRDQGSGIRDQGSEMTRARKRFGQHFLEPVWVEKLVRTIAPQSGETFLEIGPGRGALTRPLAARAAHVVAIEIDRDLVADLRHARVPRLTVVEADVLKM